jgi:uncharacterized protein YwqG
MNDLKSRVINTCRRKVENGMPPAMAEAIVRLLQPSIRLLPQPDQETRLGGSRIGGLPDLPEGVPWPVYLGPPQPDATWEAFKGEPLAFLLQVNLAEVAPFDLAGLLPKSGTLYFFYLEANSRLGHYPDYGEILQVLYSPEGTRGRRASPPHNLPHEEVYRGFALSAHLEWTVPRYDDLAEAVTHEGMLDPPEIAAGLAHWDALVEEIADLQGLGPWYKPKHRMLGYPDFIQAGGCGPGDWKLLLQVDSDPRFSVSPYKDDPGPGMMWGDAGHILFGIEGVDLEASDFANVWAVFECH